MLKQLGAAHVLVSENVRAADVRSNVPTGVDAVLDLLGTPTLMDSLAMARVGGRVCIAGFLAGGHRLEQFDPVFQMPSGVHLSAFASAFAFSSDSYPLSAIPFHEFVRKAAAGAYRAQPARVFPFDEIAAAQRLMESNGAGGKVVVMTTAGSGPPAPRHFRLVQIGREPVRRRRDGIEQHDCTDLSPVTHAVGNHMHEHLLTRHATRCAVRKSEIDSVGQLVAVERRYVVDILPIARSDVGR
jgi:hypothetical protein